MSKLVTISNTKTETAWLFVVEYGRIVWAQHFSYFSEWWPSYYEGQLYPESIPHFIENPVCIITEETF